MLNRLALGGVELAEEVDRLSHGGVANAGGCSITVALKGENDRFLT
jgi:hypothetical protein